MKNQIISKKRFNISYSFVFAFMPCSSIIQFRLNGFYGFRFLLDTTESYKMGWELCIEIIAH